MNQFKANLLSVVKEEINNNVTMGIATVTDFDLDHNFAEVRFQHPNGKEMELTEVPVRLAEGMSSPYISSGTSVVMVFPNGDLLTGFIIAIIDMNHRFNTKIKSRHKRKGSFIPNQISSRGDF